MPNRSRDRAVRILFRRLDEWVTLIPFGSGLFEYLLPIFKQKTGITVKVLAQGTGQALDTARRGAIIDPLFAPCCYKPDQRHHDSDRLAGTCRRNPSGCYQFLGHFQFAKRSQKGLQPACASRNVAT